MLSQCFSGLAAFCQPRHVPLETVQPQPQVPQEALQALQSSLNKIQKTIEDQSGKIATMEFRQCKSIPAATDAFRLLDQFARKSCLYGSGLDDSGNSHATPHPYPWI